MDLNRLYEILDETTVPLRKGEVVHGDAALVEAIKSGADELPGGIVTIDAMPHHSELRPEMRKVDCHSLFVGVHEEIAKERRAELVEILRNYPQPERLAGGPSYIEVGAQIGDQGAALQLYALGEVLGFWSVITPAKLGITGPEADSLAGGGMVMISGFRPDSATAQEAPR